MAFTAPVYLRNAWIKFKKTTGGHAGPVQLPGEAFRAGPRTGRGGDRGHPVPAAGAGPRWARPPGRWRSTASRAGARPTGSRGSCSITRASSSPSRSTSTGRRTPPPRRNPGFTGTCRAVPTAYGGEKDTFAEFEVVLPVSGMPTLVIAAFSPTADPEMAEDEDRGRLGAPRARGPGAPGCRVPPIPHRPGRAHRPAPRRGAAPRARRGRGAARHRGPVGGLVPPAPPPPGPASDPAEPTDESGDTGHDHGWSNCTMSAGSMALAFHTQGRLGPWGGDLRHSPSQPDMTGGTDLYDVAAAWGDLRRGAPGAHGRGLGGRAHGPRGGAGADPDGHGQRARGCHVRRRPRHRDPARDARRWRLAAGRPAVHGLRVGDRVRAAGVGGAPGAHGQLRAHRRPTRPRAATRRM